MRPQGVLLSFKAAGLVWYPRDVPSWETPSKCTVASGWLYQWHFLSALVTHVSQQNDTCHLGDGQSMHFLSLSFISSVERIGAEVFVYLDADDMGKELSSIVACESDS